MEIPPGVYTPLVTIGCAGPIEMLMATTLIAGAMLSFAPQAGRLPWEATKKVNGIGVSERAMGLAPRAGVLLMAAEDAVREGYQPFKPVTASNFITEIEVLVQRHDSHETPFIQAVAEVAESLAPLFEKEPSYYFLFKTMLEPERLLQFRVPWIDDKGRTRCNRGWRVQWSSALGPYKGGLRFHPTVDTGVIKFLAFEQTFKNALTGMSLGSGKGGADFNPKGKSEAEIMRFCQSFMTALAPHIGPNRDVPAGDIGVGGKEIGYMYGQYKRLKQGEFEGVLTGKSPAWGGSLIRSEATGYGCVYFAQAALAAAGVELHGKRALISGSGNVAQFTAKKLLALGAIPLTFSDSGGTVYEPDGFTDDQLDQLVAIKSRRGGRVLEYAQASSTAQYMPGQRPWSIEGAELAFPSATQNEIEDADAAALVANGCVGVFEGANMPSTPDAVARYEDAGIIFGPSKAANAGGVAVSGLEMAQNSQRVAWEADEVERRLQGIMETIHKECKDAADKYGFEGNLKAGANIAGFLRVANALRDQGAV